MAAGNNIVAWVAVGGNRAVDGGQYHVEATCFHDPHREDLDEGT